MRWLRFLLLAALTVAAVVATMCCQDAAVQPCPADDNRAAGERLKLAEGMSGADFTSASPSALEASSTAASSMIMVVGHLRDYKQRLPEHLLLARMLEEQTGEPPSICVVTYPHLDAPKK